MLGYDIIDKKLTINPEEAELVQLIFKQYLKIKSINELREFLQLSGFKSKEWNTSKGKRRGGANFSSSMIARILRARIYIGKIENKATKECYDGLHEPIIDKKLFNEVQSLLDSNRNQQKETYNREGYLLSGKIFDHNGNQFKNQKSSKSAVRKYRYYKMRENYLPAGDMESVTFQVLENIFDYPLGEILSESQTLAFKSVDFPSLTPTEKSRLLKMMIEKVLYLENRLIYFIRIDDLTYLKAFSRKNFINTRPCGDSIDQKIYASADGEHLIIEKEIHINRGNCTNKYLGTGGKIVTVGEKNTALIRALALGWRYGKMLMEGMSVNDIRKKEKIGARSIYRYLTLNTLSPNIVNDIMDNRIPEHVNLQTLIDIATMYGDFEEQEKGIFAR